MRYAAYHPKRGITYFWTKDGKVSWGTPALWWAVGMPEWKLRRWLEAGSWKVQWRGLETLPTTRHIKIITTLAALIPTLPARYSEVDKDADKK